MLPPTEPASPTDSPPDARSYSLQCHALAAYLELRRLRAAWQRSLILVEGEAPDASAVALGGLAAGAAVLWTSANAAAMRSANQSGAADFIVDSLAEAVRILKNEIRKGNPVSVGVIAEPLAVWTEATRRGLQPQAIRSSDASLASLQSTFLLRCAHLLPQSLPGADIAFDQAATWRERSARDAHLLQVRDSSVEANTEMSAAPGQGREAADWFAAAPALFPRDLFRCYSALWFATERDASNRTA